MASRTHRTSLRLLILTAALAAAAAVVPTTSASSPHSMSFTKMCNPDFCTVDNSSAPNLIPDGSTLTYSGPRFDPHLSSGFVLRTTHGTASGHCTLSWASGLGHCIIGHGTGSLAGFHAALDEWVDFGTGDFSTFVFHLTGMYLID